MTDEEQGTHFLTNQNVNSNDSTSHDDLKEEPFNCRKRLCQKKTNIEYQSAINHGLVDHDLLNARNSTNGKSGRSEDSYMVMYQVVDHKANNNLIYINKDDNGEQNQNEARLTEMDGKGDNLVIDKIVNHIVHRDQTLKHAGAEENMYRVWWYGYSPIDDRWKPVCHPPRSKVSSHFTEKLCFAPTYQQRNWQQALAQTRTQNL